MRLKKHWKRLKHLRRSFICFILLLISIQRYRNTCTVLFAYYFKICNYCVTGLYCICFLSQLPARQEPVLDSSKYTAADVRIVSKFSMIWQILYDYIIYNYIYNLACLVIFFLSTFLLRIYSLFFVIIYTYIHKCINSYASFTCHNNSDRSEATCM